MSYIGRKPQVGNYQTCDSLTASSTATYNLTVGGVAVSPISAHHCLVSLNGILQAPISSYTISGSTIVFASSLSSSDSIDFITILGNTLDTGTPSDGTVTTAKLASTSVTGAKINNDIISAQTALASEPADTDEFLVSDAGTLKRIDYSLIQPGLVKLASSTASDSASIAFNSTYINSTYDNYLLVGHGVRAATDGAEPYLGVSVNNGSSLLGNDVYSGRHYVAMTGSSDSGQEISTITSYAQLATNVGNDGDANFHVHMYGVNTAYTGANKFWNSTYTTKHQTVDDRFDTGMIFITDSAVNYIIFKMSSGNLTTGVLTLYGYKK